jgi:hypothetical protein
MAQVGQRQGSPSVCPGDQAVEQGRRPISGPPEVRPGLAPIRPADPGSEVGWLALVGTIGVADHAA